MKTALMIFVLGMLAMLAMLFVGCGNSSTSTNEGTGSSITQEELDLGIEGFDQCTEDSDCIYVPYRCECGDEIINQIFEDDYDGLHDRVDCPDPSCQPPPPVIMEAQCIENVCVERLAE